MVAARIQDLAFASHGTLATPAPITASSQGGLMSSIDAIQPLRCTGSGFSYRSTGYPFAFQPASPTSEDIGSDPVALRIVVAARS